MSTVDLHATI